MDNKTKYRHFSKQETDIPIFSRPWYLDAVCQQENKNWDVVLFEKNGKVLASFPYYVKKSGPFQVSVMPHLTKFLGPYFSKDFRTDRQKRKLLPDLIDQLPKFAFFNQNCFYDLQDWLPFYWKGFKQTTSYSYVLNDLSDLNKVYQNISSNYRNNKIKKAREVVRVVTNRSPEAYYEVEAMSFERQNLPFPFSLDYFKKYDAEIATHHARQFFFAVDAEDRIHSVAYLLIDQDRTYYHMAGDNPDLRNSGAGILLAWEAIRYTKEELGLNIFDFEGSTIQSIEKVRREFGAVQVPYFNLTRYQSRLYQFLRILRS